MYEARGSKSMKINLRIDRLVLDGLPIASNQGMSVQSAIKAELHRLLREGGISSELKSGGAFPSRPPNSIQSNPEGSPRAIGKQIAAAVYSRIGVNK